MPVYEFVEEGTGQPVEAFLPMAEAPEFGQVIELDGRKLRRVVSLPQPPCIDKGFVSRQPAKWHPDAPAHDEKGHAVFANRQQAREFCKKNNGDGLASASFDVDY